MRSEESNQARTPRQAFRTHLLLGVAELDSLDHPPMSFVHELPAWWPRMEPGPFWALLTHVDWPDLLPQQDDSLEEIDALSHRCADRLVKATSFADRVAFAGTYLERAGVLRRRMYQWEDAGTPVMPPAGTYTHVLPYYAVERGQVAYERAASQPEAASGLANEPGFKTLADSLVSFRDMLAQSLAQVTEAELDDFMSSIAVREFSRHTAGPSLNTVLHHPRLGLGVVVSVDDEGSSLDKSDERPPRPPSFTAVFANEERTFTGQDRFWTSTRENFIEAALDLLRREVTGAPVERFWEIVDGLGWEHVSRGAEPLDEVLSKRTSLAERLSLLARFWSLKSQLTKHIESWEKQTGQTLPAGDDSFGDLVSHIIGLGRAEYEATWREPERALRRAERRDYRESFAYVLIGATQSAQRGEVEELVSRQASRPDVAARLVEHPVHGMGIRSERASESVVLFWDHEAPASG